MSENFDNVRTLPVKRTPVKIRSTARTTNEFKPKQPAQHKPKTPFNADQLQANKPNESGELLQNNENPDEPGSTKNTAFLSSGDSPADPVTAQLPEAKPARMKYGTGPFAIGSQYRPWLVSTIALYRCGSQRAARMFVEQFGQGRWTFPQIVESARYNQDDSKAFAAELAEAKKRLSADISNYAPLVLQPQRLIVLNTLAEKALANGEDYKVLKIFESIRKELGVEGGSHPNLINFNLQGKGQVQITVGELIGLNTDDALMSINPAQENRDQVIRAISQARSMTLRLSAGKEAGDIIDIDEADAKTITDDNILLD